VSFRNPTIIIEADGFTEKAITIFGPYSKWEEIKDFIDIYIARDPRGAGKLVPGTTVYRLKLNTTPSTLIYYHVDAANEDRVTLLEIFAVT
jgi:hypothetical protein